MQLLSLYHDTLLLRAASPAPSPHSRYTRHWTARSAAYRRVAYVLQMVRHTELLWEMAAKRRGERVRWRVVVVLELVKAACRLLILRITRRRPLVTPPLPERAPVPDNQQDEHEHEQDIPDDEHEVGGVRAPDREWPMPRTRLSLPPLPAAGDTTAFLLARVLTADDVKPAAQLLRARGGRAHAAEVLHALAPLAYALALAGARDRRGWAPWGSGLAVELAARGLREREGLRATALEREEWGRRGWALGRWAMRGPFYDGVTKGVVEGVKKRVPGLVAGILEDYAYLWENYYFSTSG